MPPSPASIGIITSTYFPNAYDSVQRVRARLAIAAIGNAIQAGYTVTIVDSGSDPSLFPVRELGARVVSVEDEDMASARNQALALALDAGVTPSHVAWTEPEKDITPWVTSWVERSITEGAAIVIPMRTRIDSYPLYQQRSERAGNEDLASLFGVELGDHYFGPRVFTHGAAADFWLDNKNAETAQRQWASIFSPVWRAMAAGARVVGVPCDFTYPITQASVENNDVMMSTKRDLQRTVVTQSALDAIGRLHWSDDYDFHLLDDYRLRRQVMSPNADETSPSMTA